jgi:hypothetical protein
MSDPSIESETADVGELDARRLDPADLAFLEQAVQGLRDDLPDDVRMFRLERRLAPVLDPETAPVRWWQRRHVRVALGAAIVFGGVVIARHGSESKPVTPPPAPREQTIDPLTSPAPVPIVPATPVVSIDALPTAPTVQPSTQRGVVSKTKHGSVDPAPTPSDGDNTPAADSGDELALLEEARSALGTNPARTLALADIHTKRFLKPSFAQERERLAIEALTRLGRRPEAEQRAKLFETTYPHSAHLARVRALVAPEVAP